MAPVRLLIIACLLQFQNGPLADDMPTRQQLVSISPETTRITSPLDERGFVDYVAALNQRARKGVTKENNYEVVVREVLGPIHTGEKQIEYFRQLGIEPPVPDGNYYITYPAFAGIEELSDEHSRLMDHPWTAMEFPKAAEWIKLMDDHLDRVVEGSKRKKYYTPYTVLVEAPEREGTSPLMNVSLESAQQQRDIARGLKLRAMGRIGSGHLDGAWGDLQAIRRMSRHVAGGWTPIEALIGCAIDSMAFDGEQLILQSSALTDDQAHRFLKDLQNVPRLPPLLDIWNQGERLLALDALQSVLRSDDNSTAIGNLFNLEEDPGALEVPVDWDMAFKTINRFYDRLVDASREENPDQQRELFQDLDVELRRLKAKYESQERTADILEAGDKSLAMGKAVGEIYSYLLCPAFLQAEDAQDRAAARLDLIRLGFAVEVFKRDQRRYPDALNELTPEYLKSIPIDPFSGNSLIYRRSEKGALIYSVGSNLHDDFGDPSRAENRTSNQMDDIMVRIGKPVIPLARDRDSNRTVLLAVGVLAGLIALAGFVILKKGRKKRATE